MTQRRKQTIKRAMLVYQAGLANLFAVSSFNLADYGRDAKRFYQGDLHTAECIAYGLILGGATVTSVYCNQAGDVAREKWSDNLDDAPFREYVRPQYSANVQQTA